MHIPPLSSLSLQDLRHHWAQAWQQQPHRWISRSMLEKSLAYKHKEQQGLGLSLVQHQRLQRMVAQYKRNPHTTVDSPPPLAAGMRLVRHWQGVAHSVTVTPEGFCYNGQTYKSLSRIASTITGTRWNGWLFFGLKNPTVTP